MRGRQRRSGEDAGPQQGGPQQHPGEEKKNKKNRTALYNGTNLKVKKVLKCVYSFFTVFLSHMLLRCDVVLKYLQIL